MITSLAIAAAVSLANAGPAPESTAPRAVEARARNRLTVGPASLLLGRVALEYERALSDRVSLTLGPQFSPGGFLGIGGRDASLTLGARLFVIGRAPHGLWFGTEFVPSYSEARDFDTGALRSSTRSFTGLGTIGLSLALGPLSASAGAGAGWAVFDERAVDGTRSRGGVPAVSLHLNTGVTF